MKGKEVRKIIAQHDCCAELRRKGSHVFIRCDCTAGEEPVVCTTVVPDHGAKDLGKGLLASIESDLAPCLGKGWLRK